DWAKGSRLGRHSIRLRDYLCNRQTLQFGPFQACGAWVAIVCGQSSVTLRPRSRAGGPPQPAPGSFTQAHAGREQVNHVRLGINLWSQATDWPGFLGAATRADALGYDHVWTWDHLLAIFGDPDQPVMEGYTALAAVAMATKRAKLGLFVGANT